MTEQELQKYCDEEVELSYGGQTAVGTLICGTVAQIGLHAPYGIETRVPNASPGSYDIHRVAIPSSEAVQWVRPVEAERRTPID
jgi:hypothetical protein